MNGWIWPTFYLVGVLCCVYHLANGLWTAGITWGLWISPDGAGAGNKDLLCSRYSAGDRRGQCLVGGGRPGPDDVLEMRATEDRMYRVGVEAGLVEDIPEKRSDSKAPL